MKRLMVTATLLGLASAASALHATDRHLVNLHHGFAILGIVAHTPAEFAQAQREADAWEGRRHLGLGPVSIAAIAIDASNAPQDATAAAGAPPARVSAASPAAEVALD
jgi:hypothetical protein